MTQRSELPSNFIPIFLGFEKQTRRSCVSQLLDAVTKIPDTGNLKEERFIGVQGFRGSVCGWLIPRKKPNGRWRKAPYLRTGSRESKRKYLGIR